MTRLTVRKAAPPLDYFDQAHFIHDFRAFSGLTPSEWAARRTAHVNHIPMLD